VKAFGICLGLLLAAGTASAQMYRWVDKDGKVRYSDVPPTGTKAASVKAPPPPATPPAVDAKDAKGAKKGPLTPAEQEQEYRKRRAEAQKAAEETAEEGRVKSERAEVCARAKEQLATLQRGGRVARTNASGEQYILDESQVAREVDRAQQNVQKACK